MTGLTVCETQRGDLATAPFFRRIAERGVESLVAPPDPPDLRGYVEHAVIGGYSDPVLGMPVSRRARWQLSYLDRLLTRDVDTDDVLRNGDILGRMIETFVLAQLRAELPLYDQPPRLYHLRQGRRCS